MIKISKTLLILFVMILAVSCSVKKNSVKKSDRETNSAAELWSRIEAQRIDFDWYHAKAGVQVSFEDFNMGGQADIRIKRDSVIFISVRKFGIELVRALIRPDSAFALNRLQANYAAMSLDSLKTEFGLPFGFSQLQDMMIGNHYAGMQVPIVSKQDENGISLRMADDHLITDYVLSTDYQVKKAAYRDQEGRKVEVYFEDYKDFEGVFSAGKREYFYPNKLNPEYQFDFQLNQVTINQPKKIRFEIPSGYTKI